MPSASTSCPRRSSRPLGRRAARRLDAAARRPERRAARELARRAGRARRARRSSGAEVARRPGVAGPEHSGTTAGVRPEPRRVAAAQERPQPTPRARRPRHGRPPRPSARSSACPRGRRRSRPGARASRPRDLEVAEPDRPQPVDARPRAPTSSGSSSDATRWSVPRIAHVLTSVRSRHRRRGRRPVAGLDAGWIASSAEPITCAWTATRPRTTSSTGGGRLGEVVTLHPERGDLVPGRLDHAASRSPVCARGRSRSIVHAHPRPRRELRSLARRSSAARPSSLRRTRRAPCARSGSDADDIFHGVRVGGMATRSTTRWSRPSGSRPSATTASRRTSPRPRRCRRTTRRRPTTSRRSAGSASTSAGSGPGPRRGAGLRPRTRLRHARRDARH